MALSGSRLTTNLAADILTQLQAQYPVPALLLAAEKAAYAAAQTNLANAIANAAGPDVVTEVKLATVATSGSGADPQGGTVTVTSTGTVS